MCSRHLRLCPLVLGIVTVAAAFFFPSTGFADRIINFESADGVEFLGDAVGDTAGPFTIDGYDVTFTTQAIAPGGVVATSSFGLGVDSGTGDPDPASFNLGEAWVVSADHRLNFVGLELGGLQIEETFSVQSNSWINLTGIVTGTGVTYEASSGTFVLTDGPAGDVFTLNELTGGTLLPVFNGSSISFGNLTSTFGPNDDVELQNITLQAIPEPASIQYALLIAAGGLLRSRRRRRSLASDTKRSL